MKRRVVITGIGTLNSCGEGRAAYWEAALASRSGLSALDGQEFDAFGIKAAGIMREFKASKYIANRKSLKVMCRDIQMAVAASALAREDASLAEGAYVPERSGVCIGAGLFNYELQELADCFRASANERGFDAQQFGKTGMSQLFPLWLLKYLPNMPACHITIAHNLRGPSNTITTDGAASAAAFEEAVHIIERGTADLMFSGGAESKLNASGILRYRSLKVLADAGAVSYEVFTKLSAGIVPGEGASVLVLEELEHARKRGAKIYAEVAGVYACANTDGSEDVDSRAAAMSGALAEAGLSPDALDLLHLSAGGIFAEDKSEALAVSKVFEGSRQKPLLAATKGLTGYMGYAAAANEISLAAMSVSHRRAVPSPVR